MEAKSEDASTLPIRSLALGVRYDPQYRVRDHMGSLVDAILHAVGTPFNPKFFPLTEADPFRQQLMNEETEDKLAITQSDTVLEFHTATEDLREIARVARDFQNFVLGPLYKVCGVHKMVRYGLLVRFDEKGIQTLQHPIARYGDPDLPKARDFVIRFSHRLATQVGYMQRGVNDFRNVFYVMQETGEGRVSLSLDYQEYFSPVLEASELSERSYSKFAALKLFLSSNHLRAVGSEA